MCRIFAGQSPENYECVTRSLRLDGHSTSIRLERAYWTILEEIAESQDMSLPRFLSLLHDEILELRGEVANFTSLLRCACLTYVSEVRGREPVEVALRAEAAAHLRHAPVAAE